MATEPVKDTDPTIGALVSNASRDISTLINKEIQLAKSELKLSVKFGTAGAVMFAGAAFLGLLAVIMFSVFLAHLIHWNGSGLDLHWAYLIVTLLYVAIAAALAYVGYRKVRQVRAPERAIHQAQETSQLLKRG